MRLGHLAVIVSLSALPGACRSQPPGDAGYVESVEAARKAKDGALGTGSESPVPPEKRATVLPLAYYPVDPAYAVPAAFEEAPAGRRLVIEVDTSTHQPRRMERIGVLKFALEGKPLQLAAFREPEDPPDRLFVPFADETSGRETYAAGRYLEVPRSATGVHVVDFNRAFNPYCYYNPTYDCPLPPRENRLPVPIRAGERVKPEAQ